MSGLAQPGRSARLAGSLTSVGLWIFLRYRHQPPRAARDGHGPGAGHRRDQVQAGSWQAPSLVSGRRHPPGPTWAAALHGYFERCRPRSAPAARSWAAQEAVQPAPHPGPGTRRVERRHPQKLAHLAQDPLLTKPYDHHRPGDPHPAPSRQLRLERPHRPPNLARSPNIRTTPCSGRDPQRIRTCRLTCIGGGFRQEQG